MTLDDPNAVVMGKEPILDGDQVLSYVTSAGYGHSIGRGIVYGYLPISHSDVKGRAWMSYTLGTASRRLWQRSPSTTQGARR